MKASVCLLCKFIMLKVLEDRNTADKQNVYPLYKNF